jgi:hypothetical protein
LSMFSPPTPSHVPKDQMSTFFLTGVMPPRCAEVGLFSVIS